MNVNVYIERLILEGVEVSSLDRPALQAAVESELTRLLVEGGLHPDLTAGGARASMRGGAFQPPAGGKPDHLGQQIARAVYGGIGK